MEKEEFYKQAEIPQEEIERMKKIEYPTYVSESVLNEIDLREKSVLDAGAGPNPNLAEFVHKKGGMYMPFDIRKDVLDSMKGQLERKGEGTPFWGIQGNVEEIKTIDNFADVVHERFVLMNLKAERRAQALEELLRVAKEDLILIEYNWRTMGSPTHPEVAEKFRDLAQSFFEKISTDPYMGEQLESLIKEVDPNIQYSIQHFERAADKSNVPELILTIRALGNAAKGMLKDESLAASLEALASDLEKSPIDFMPPDIVVANIKK